MQRPHRGFTLIETMAVLAVIAILAMLAVPSFQGRIVRSEIVQGARLADVAKAPIAALWSVTRSLPADNAAAGLPAPEKIVGNLVSSVTVEGGAIHVGFGNRANAAIRGKTLTWRPAVVDDAAVVPMEWLCGHAPAVPQMTARGIDRTTVEDRFLPLNCRAGS